MMYLIKKGVLGGLVLGCFVMMGCASSQLVESWQEPSFEDKPLGKILVLGVFQEDESRRLYEDAVVKALEKGKGSAIAGYTLMPKVENYDEKEDIMAAVAIKSVDPKSGNQLVNDVSDLIVKDMKNAGFL